MDDFKINDSTLTDNLLPNEGGSLEFTEEERLDEQQQQENEERHMIRSAGSPMLDWLDARLTDEMTRLDTLTAARATAKTEDCSLEEAGTAHALAVRIVSELKHELLAMRGYYDPKE